MPTRWRGWALAVAAICSLAACGGDGEQNNGGASGTSGVGGSGGGGAGSGGDAPQCGGEPVPCQNSGEDDVSCPYTVGPFTGESCAPKGECCHRSSNQAKIDRLCPDDPMVLEYRVTSAAPNNHPLSTSLSILKMGALMRATTCAGDQCLLMRFVEPRAGGMPIAGPGKISVAIGRYNCDGTYSFYNDTVAPTRAAEGFTDAARWNAEETDTTVDPMLSGPAHTKIAWASNSNRGIATSPFFLSGTSTIDWEVATSGFEMLAFDTSEAGRDCQGRWTGSMWETTGRYQTFAPLAENSKDLIDSVTQSFCQLLSFGVLDPADRGIDCLETPRCVPNSQGCKYIKLPDALCPANDAQRDIFGCHLGALGNPNAEIDYPSDTEINCTMTAPTAPLDPDKDETVSKGQCCDPLGAGSDGLPACNAFRIVNDFAAAAAEITTQPAAELPPVCR